MQSDRHPQTAKRRLGPAARACAALLTLCAALALLWAGAHLVFGVRRGSGWPATSRMVLDEQLPLAAPSAGFEMYCGAAGLRVHTCPSADIGNWLHDACSPRTSPPTDRTGVRTGDTATSVQVQAEVAANMEPLRMLLAAADEPYWSPSADTIRAATKPGDLRSHYPDYCNALASLAGLACAHAILLARSGNTEEALEYVDASYALGVNMTQGALPAELWRAWTIVARAHSAEEAILRDVPERTHLLPPYEDRKEKLRGRLWPLSEVVRLDGCRNLRELDLVVGGGPAELAPYFVGAAEERRAREGLASALAVMAVSSPRDTRAWASDRYARLEASCDPGGDGSTYNNTLDATLDDLEARRDYLGIMVTRPDYSLERSRDAWVRMSACLTSESADTDTPTGTPR